MKNPIYEPDDDSFLLADALKKELKDLKNKKIDFSNLKLLDMGTGSGYLGEIAVKKRINTTFVDTNPEAIERLNKKFKNKKNTSIIESDLFEKLENEKFDLIIFNTPYLPEDEELFDPALHGGKKGYEVTIKFIKQINNHLIKNGLVLFLISSLTHPDVIEAELYKQNLEFKITSRKKLFFEELLIYRVKQDE